MCFLMVYRCVRKGSVLKDRYHNDKLSLDYQYRVEEVDGVMEVDAVMLGKVRSSFGSC